VVDEFAVYLAGKDPSALVFTSPTGAPLRNRNARRGWFDAAAEQAGAAGLTPHELRHTAASLAVSAGANVKAVQRMLGHASAALTLDRYADLFDDDLDGVAERLDAVGRAAGVAYPLPTAEVVDLSSARK
jgi:integrase